MKPNIFQIIIILLFVFFIGTTLSYSQDREYDELKEKIQKLENLPSREYNKMLDKCDKLIKKYETTDKKIVAEAYLWSSLIKLQINRRRGDAVITDLNLGLKYNPQNSELHRELGLAYRDQGETRSAIASLKTAIELNDKDITAITALIEIYQPNNHTSSIIELRQIYLRQKPDDFEMLFGLALDQLSLEDTSSAITSLEKAINVNKKFTKARFKLAEIKEQIGDLEGAKSEYKAILGYDKNNEKAETASKRVEYRSKSKTRMEDLLKEGKRLLLSSDPRDWARSIACFDTVWIYEPQNAEVKKYRKEARGKVYTHCFNEGEKMMSKGRWEEAVNHFKISVGSADVDSDRTKAFNKLEQAAKKLGKELGAINAKDLAVRFYSKGEFEEALKWFIAAEKFYPPSAKDFEDDLVEAELKNYFKKGSDAILDEDYCTAKTYFGEIKKRKPQYEEINSLYKKADTLLTRQIVEKKLKESYKKEMENKDWYIAKGLALFIKKYYKSDEALQNDLNYIESQFESLIDYSVFYSVLALCGLFFLILIHLWGNNKQPKIAAWIRFFLVTILFFAINLIILYLILTQGEGANILTKIASCTFLFTVGNFGGLIFAKIYLRNHIQHLFLIGRLIRNLFFKIE